ncbi:MAG: hypothetical protein PHI23_03850 [Candidatus Peribacteraceae bacterium]|nr:hypothetical protein [Candidatus Peribacteraceae bacterium]
MVAENRESFTGDEDTVRGTLTGSPNGEMPEWSGRGTMPPIDDVHKALADAQAALDQLYPQDGDATARYRAEGLQAKLDEFAQEAQRADEASRHAELLLMAVRIRTFMEELRLPDVLVESAA